MKKKTKRLTDRDTMRANYDFRGGVRGKYVSRYRAGTNVVVLDPDVADAFPTADAVNRALRALLDAVPPRRARRRTGGRARARGLRRLTGPQTSRRPSDVDERQTGQ